MRTQDPNVRVEAVDTAGHWPAVYLADADIPLARGWFRQDDFPQNEVLYSKLGPRTYLQWLHGLGVGYVVLARTTPDYSSIAEAALVRSGRAGLTRVYKDGDHHDLPRPALPADRHRAGQAARRCDDADAHHRRRQERRDVPHRRALVAVLAHVGSDA